MFLATHGILRSGGEEPYANIYSFEYDGSTSYINLKNDISFNNDGTSPFTFSTWIKTTSTDNFNFIFSRQLNTSPFNGLSFYLKDGNRFNVFIGTITSNARIQGYTSATSVNDGNWHHVSVSYDGSQSMSGFSVYLDGSAVSISTTEYNNTPNNCNASINASIGVRGSHVGSRQYYFNGRIYDSAFYTSELTSSNIATIYGGGTPSDLNENTFIPHTYIRPQKGSYSNGVANEWLLENLGTSNTDATTENILESERVEDAP